MSIADLAGGLLGFALTLCIFSYLFGDNRLYQIASHIFIGTAAGYAALVAWNTVLWPRMLQPFWQGQVGFSERLLLSVPIVLCLLLLTKATRKLAGLGSPVVAFLVGVGVAAAIGGAIQGTIVPQISASIHVFEPPRSQDLSDVRLHTLNASVILISTIATLVYFQARRSPWAKSHARADAWLAGLGWIGKFSFAVALGVLFSGVMIAALTALVGRMHFLIMVIHASTSP